MSDKLKILRASINDMRVTQAAMIDELLTYYRSLAGDDHIQVALALTVQIAHTRADMDAATSEQAKTLLRVLLVGLASVFIQLSQAECDKAAERERPGRGGFSVN